ncbi:MAG: hypothetical protein H6733_02140 [Alphaproteobacteria bacterium]|nr:hypothetical protein [Alphaproteobacteria bacterium]
MSVRRLRAVAPLATVFAALLATSPAHAALGGDKAGWYVDVGVGLGAGDLPFTPGVGWTAAVGGWLGRYDDDYALGRHWGVGARFRQDVQLAPGRRTLRSAPMLEVRRGVDLLVVGLHVAVLGGPLLETTLDASTTPGTRLAGGTARLAGDVVYRFRPHAGLALRVETGVDVDALHAEPVLAATVGFTFSAPVPRRGSTR